MTKRSTSPTLQIKIGEQQYERAIKSNSGGCLIADAIKSQYPHLKGVTVDMATVRATDPDKGVRYTYLTPPAGQQMLVWFDQGWRHPQETLTIKRAVKIDKITTNGRPTKQKRAEQRQERLTQLEAKLDSGEDLTPAEKGSLTRMTNPKPTPERPTARGPRTEVITSGNQPATVVGGNPLPQLGRRNPNMLAGRNRHFGAKLANPGEAFTNAVEEAIRAGGYVKYDQPSFPTE